MARKGARNSMWWLLGSSLVLLIWACGASTKLSLKPLAVQPWEVKTIPAEPQLLAGDARRGFDYMKRGAYLGTGLPAAFMHKPMAKDSAKFLRNSGMVTSAGLGFFTSHNGVEVSNGTCFTCHAGVVAGDTILGIGNSLADFRGNVGVVAKLLNTRMKLAYKADDPAYVQYEDFSKYLQAMADGTQTHIRGVNPAARIAETIMRHRDPQDLTYVDTPLYAIGTYNIASDTPPLWNVAKKHALYYTAIGRGDMTKLIFQASVLGIPDSTQARKAQEAFVDVLAWLRKLEPPAYPENVDRALAERGKLIFEDNCASCHGTYGALFSDRSDDTYPNKLVSVDKVGTDPYYASYAVSSEITGWYNRSWFATSYPQSRFEPEAGYIAPPLDGIWATAPYLHNGSVPTLYEVLKSEARPDFWERQSLSSKLPTGSKEEYDFKRVGWTYKVHKRATSKTYNTALPGYGNQGHRFGDKLNEEERWAVVEYLKTL